VCVCVCARACVCVCVCVRGMHSHSHTLTHSHTHNLPRPLSCSLCSPNYLGHFVLINGLMDLLLASAPSRVVHVSSDAQHHGYAGGLRGAGDLASINDPVDAVSFKNYGQAKLCNTLFSNALNRRYGDKGL
jgi:NAD(P)-dependent dehydrogenase (short-subunit alcohol dehydrogenase family)